MRRTLAFLLLGCGSAGAARAADEPAPPPVRPSVTVAIFNFSSYYPRQRQELTDLIIGHLSGQPGLAVLDRGELDKALAEQLLDASGNLSADLAVKFRNLAGANVIVTGQLSRVLNDRCTATVRIVSTRSGRAYSRTADGRGLADVPRMASELSARITDAILDPAFDAGVVPAPTREQRIAEMIRRLGPGRRGAVRLRFNEGGPGDLPAVATAETEFGFILQKAGFTLVDGESRQSPDFTVTGTIVCETGGRRNGLYSSRADLAIKVRAEGTGAVVLLDRQSGDAVGLGKQTAADAAIEEGADQLAARLLPQLLR